MPHERSLLVSITFLGFLPILFAVTLPLPIQDDPNRSATVVPAYLVLCALGVVAALYPRVCSRPLGSLHSLGKASVRLGPDQQALKGRGRLLNHHPHCHGFENHEFQLMGRSVCAGCAGMVTGAGISSVIVTAYFEGGWKALNPSGYFVAIGGLLVAICLPLTILIAELGRVARFLLSFLFVLGTSLVLVGVDTLRGSIVIDSYVLVLALFWVYVRVRSSQLTHAGVCAECSVVCPHDGKTSRIPESDSGRSSARFSDATAGGSQ